MRGIRIVAATTAAAVVAVLAPGADAATTKPKVAGAGVDTHGLEFEFKAKRPRVPHGYTMFETNSFGDIEGPVACLAIDHRRAALSGPISDPGPSGLTHYMIILNDRDPSGGEIRDRVVTWLRNGPFDCEAEGSGDLADSLERIRRGYVRIVR